MDWLDQMAMYADHASIGAGDAEDEEDFYDDGQDAGMLNGSTSAADVTPGATDSNGKVNVLADTAMLNSNVPSTPGNSYINNTVGPKVLSDEQKAENERKTKSLREKLLAQRQNTPVKQQSRAASVAPQHHPALNVLIDQKQKQTEPSSDIGDVDMLLAEGKAAAEAESKEQEMAPTTSPPTSKPYELTSTTQQPRDSQQTSKVRETKHNNGPGSNDVLPKPLPPTKLNDPYYEDLPIWLEMTGYHDTNFRNSKLRTYKERQALEAEAARIQARLDKLKEDERLTVQSMRTAPSHPTKAQDAAPSLPETMPTGVPGQNVSTPTPATNGAKRAHSPEQIQPSKARREEDAAPGFRIRGANESPADHTLPPRGRQRSRSPQTGNSLARRISYPDDRRPSEDSGARPANQRGGFRDASLERRQSYYQARPDPRAIDLPRDREDYFNGRNPQRTSFTSRPRATFSHPNRRREDDGPVREPSQHFRGSAGLGLRQGGVRYFMIKSWNHDNVATAMRDELWATQLKNEELLTDAYNTSRHVILLFSVNKSMAFQGYALMASAPDPSLPKPPFCAKLNWGTSPAFRLRWLATTPIHFRYVGHLKNPLNVDDEGKPMAVLVGKDGQEIAAEAGTGVVEILDDVEQAEPGRMQGGANSARIF